MIPFLRGGNMGIKLKLLKKGSRVKEKGTVDMGILSNVTGKIILKTPFGDREVLPGGKLKKNK